MRKFITLTAVAVLAAAIVLPALAADPNPAATTTSPSTASNPPTRLHWFAGSVTGVGSDSLSVGVLWTGPQDGSLDGQTVNVGVDSSTSIVGHDGSADQLSSIANGDLVGIRATAQGSDLSSLTATKIRVYCNCHWVGGTIAALGSDSITVQVAKTGPYDTVLNGQSVTIGVDDSTVYVEGKDKTQIGLSDLKLGAGVGIVFSANGFFKAPGFNPATADFTAERVHQWGHRQVPPPSSDSQAAAQTSA